MIITIVTILLPCFTSSDVGIVDAYTRAYTTGRRSSSVPGVTVTGTTATERIQQQQHSPLLDLCIGRRDCIIQSAASCWTLCVPVTTETISIWSTFPQSANADVATAAITTITSSSSSSLATVIGSLQEAQHTLRTLVENYQRATVDCTFADVPRELLETKNKQLLLEKAATSALFDKSASIETCKTTNRLVRDYLGVTGKGPMVGIEKKIKLGLEYVDSDFLDDYVSEYEQFSQSYSKASSLSYTAGVADFDSVNNFGKDAVGDDNRNQNSNLQQTKGAIQEAERNLNQIIAILLKGEENTIAPSSQEL